MTSMTVTQPQPSDVTAASSVNTEDCIAMNKETISTPEKAINESGDELASEDTSTKDATDVPVTPDEETAGEKATSADSPSKNAQSPEEQDLHQTYRKLINEVDRFYFLPEDQSKENLANGMDVAQVLLKYLHSVESRMADLTKRIGTGQEDKKQANEAEQGVPPSLSYHFFHADREFNLDGELVGKNDRILAHSNNQEPHTLIRAVYSWADSIAKNPPNLPDGEPPRPEHINLIALGIFSEPIAKFFEKELGFDSVSHNVVRIGVPFRPLLRNLQAIEKHAEMLQKRFAPKETQDREDAETASKAQQEQQEQGQKQQISEANDILPFAESPGLEPIVEESYNQEEALGQFQLLLEFVNNYLSRQVNLYHRLSTGYGEKVAFPDLWMLFDTGSTIFCPSQEGGVKVHPGGYEEEIHTTQRRHLPQVYRVSATSGGIPFSKSLVPRYRASQSDFDYNQDIGEALLQPDKLGLTKLLSLKSPNMSYSRRPIHNYSPLHVMCFYIDFDGANFGTVTEIFVFKPYEGETDIKGLQAYPLQYLQAGGVQSPGGIDNISKVGSSISTDALIERGRKFIDVTAVTHMSYDGLTVGTTREEINSEIMIDFRTALDEYRESFRGSKAVVPQFAALTAFWPCPATGEFYEYYSCTDGVWGDIGNISELYPSYQKRQRQEMESKIKTLMEESGFEKMHHAKDFESLKEYMEKNDLIQLLPGVVPGYALRNRRWVQLDLNRLRYIKAEDGWNRLVLPKGHREIVQAMVETHARGSRSSVDSRDDKMEMDLVHGKGKGCIILLHGDPGVGKTSTAGDIGYVPEAVEKNMEEHFKLARRWGCVLLLDEADVFLAKRTKNDVKRNGLVSVFLRILEYYTGILFLTTNRVGAIDDAFRSRLHLTLYYPKLDKKQTIRIWKTNLKRIESNNEQRKSNGQSRIEYDKRKIIKWTEQNWDVMRWNGRQIRNAFQTAIALAEFKAGQSLKKELTSTPQIPTLHPDLFKLIAEASLQFSDYLQQTHGGDEEYTAARDQTRAPDYVPRKKAVIKDLEDSDESSSESSSSSSSSLDESDTNTLDSSTNSSNYSGSDSDELSRPTKKDKSRHKEKISEPAKDKTRKERKKKDRKEREKLEKKKAKKDREDL
ncbi:hypothetical protein N7462_005297 [Penicillium macrosclerotiorum]|uniref:uncharacterized protein n=1 Tax=Penicillium macrosclerotiorum TaxID=303699 RepID=UPI0025473766|nr:uncharacterized protein N7462_005297 [Penicillium macrosclerotiorum]KAJ5690905.1 hypothetical protein N7462_005297 [Penicillium macrosclerotiorum]